MPTGPLGKRHLLYIYPFDNLLFLFGAAMPVRRPALRIKPPLKSGEKRQAVIVVCAPFER